MKIANIYSVLISLFIFGFISCNQNKELKNEPKAYAENKIVLDLLDLQLKQELGKDTIVTIDNDPVYHKTKKYQAVDALRLLRSKIDFHKIDIKNTKIIFECKDGYQPEMPLELFLHTKSYLAFQDLGAAKGLIWEKIVKDGNEMDAAPFYLVYTLISENDARYKWPYNLIKVHLKPLNDSKKSLYPAENKNVVIGYNLFQNHCITCHAINDIGGTMGPELNYPKSVTEYWKEKELVDYIVNPAAFRHKVKMPKTGLNKKQSLEIVAYLKYMAEHKKEN
ncbi:Cytochrome c, mono-and diheme variants [Flavobacterium segetis]|uniref:Cytochrome c, mono-and diheme variants n=1 Tax=Flavobacterium segetis TaxID=271157 RepID=A0A1M5DZ79_9FLAO|nr:c-type cytochrome [Flavobacterium segetis]SHF72297.1 Cytochrome c, mono-and diheme variants [Flavobacterium segetis]